MPACDFEEHPCSRCRRLSIDCVGHGQQRYTFKNQTSELVVARRPVLKPKPTCKHPTWIVQPNRTPCNGLSSLTSAFIHSIGQDVDIKFQLTWNFGGFLASIPRRLGTSAALDAASDVLVAAHTSYCGRGNAVDPYVLTKYSQALSVLRHDLNDVVKARSSESLCAVLVLAIAQLLIDPIKAYAISHIEGAARIMKGRGFAKAKDKFEEMLLGTLRGPVVFESLLADKIHFCSEDWKLINAQGPETAELPEGQWFSCIAAVPDLLQRSRAAIRLHGIPSLHLLGYELEARSLLDVCTSVITTLRQRLHDYDPSNQPAELRNHLHAHYLRSLALALGTGIILNCVLSGLEGTRDDWLSEESSLWSQEIVLLALRAAQYRPLGAMALELCLRFAWMGAASAEAKEGIVALLAEYDEACMGGLTTDIHGCTDLTRTLKRFTLQDP
ncbi:MAG: hypothetical protein LQ344_006834 [Seirophora lacunosa]|nr:MAG: hypothetical protein LQ344_006834 [Seirophora lacunosa]